jgi:hypothetical protein
VLLGFLASGLLPVTYGVFKIRGNFFKRGKTLVIAAAIAKTKDNG